MHGAACPRSRASWSLLWCSGSRGWPRAWCRPLSAGCWCSTRAAHEPDPPGAGQGVEAKRHESERDDAKHDAAEWLAEQEEERASKALDLAASWCRPAWTRNQPITKKMTPRAAIPKRPSPIATSLSVAVMAASLRSSLKVAR